MMGNGDNHDLPIVLGIHDAEREAVEDGPSEFPPNGRADARTVPNCLNCALHIIEKRVP